jgi:hypothetical protein
MASIASDIQQILDLAPRYSKDHEKPEMHERAELTADLTRRLTSALNEVTDTAGLAGLDLRVHEGGQMGFVGVFPWVRVYSKIYAPSAQHGIYLVYLFAADVRRHSV